MQRTSGRCSVRLSTGQLTSKTSTSHEIQAVGVSLWKVVGDVSGAGESPGVQPMHLRNLNEKAITQINAYKYSN